MIEYLCGLATRRGDTKPQAKALLHEFGGISGVLSADPEALMLVKGIGETSVAAIKIAQTAALRLLKQKVTEQPMLANWQALIDYLRTDRAYLGIKRVRVLPLNSKNVLIPNKVVAEGSID